MSSKPSTTPTERVKWEIVYEDDESISVWKYDTRKTRFGPVEVEYKWKKGFNPWGQKKKTLGQLAKEARKNKKSKGSESDFN
jgi:hypothetical protein